MCQNTEIEEGEYLFYFSGQKDRKFLVLLAWCGRESRTVVQVFQLSIQARVIVCLDFPPLCTWHYQVCLTSFTWHFTLILLFNIYWVLTRCKHGRKYQLRRVPSQ